MRPDYAPGGRVRPRRKVRPDVIWLAALIPAMIVYGAAQRTGFANATALFLACRAPLIGYYLVFTAPPGDVGARHVAGRDAVTTASWDSSPALAGAVPLPGVGGAACPGVTTVCCFLYPAHHGLVSSARPLSITAVECNQ